MTKSITTTARVDIGILLLLAYPVGGSLVSILLRYLLAHFDSLTVGFVRALSGGVFLLAIALLRWRHELLGVLHNRRQMGLIVATTVFSIAPGWMVNEAMTRLPAVVTGLLSTINLPMMSLMAALVYAAPELLGVHTVGGGPRTFTLPKPVEVIYDLFAGQIVARDTDVYQVVLPAASTSLYFTGAAEKLPQVTRLTEQASSFISRPSS